MRRFPITALLALLACCAALPQQWPCPTDALASEDGPGPDRRAIAATHTTAQLPGANTPRRREADKGPVTPLETKPGFVPAPSADLVIVNLRFAPDARVSYLVQNIGQTATGNPFVVDLYLDGQRRDTVKHAPLPPLSQQLVHSNLAEAETCGAVALRAVADSQQIVSEHREDNNTQSREQLPPCPDLTVEIRKESLNNNLEYRARVVVTNRGQLSTRRQFAVLLTGAPGTAGPLPVLKRLRIGPLEPGQSFAFYEAGKHYGTTTMRYRAIADEYQEIRESREDNNQDRRTMGPH